MLKKRFFTGTVFFALLVTTTIFGQSVSPPAIHPIQSPQTSPSVDVRVLEVLSLGKDLEARAMWSEALKLYEESLRLYPDDKFLQQRYNYVRLHRDIYRRYSDPSFLKLSREMTEAELSDLVRDVLVKFNIHYVSVLTPRQIFVREINGLEIALDDEIFRSLVLKDVQEEQIRAFRDGVRKILADRDLLGTREVYDATMEIANLCRKHFPGVSPQAVVLECVCGLVNTLDPYSSVLTATQLQDAFATMRGNFVGLGVEIRLEDDSIFIQRVLPGSPAQRAGVQKGEILLAVDGQDMQKEPTADRAACCLQGAEGTDVLLVLRSPGGECRTVALRRERIVIPPLENAHIVPGSDGVAYIRVPTFQNESARALEEAMWGLYHQGMKSLVLDLRGNPGGLLLAAVEMADLFISEGVIVSTYGQMERQKQRFTAKREGTWRVPLVVLIDQDSASASEIFAGAIRDNSRGLVVGERSFGKGSVQGVFQLSQRKLGVKLTTSMFYSPSGKRYNHVGVAPDLVVHHVAKPILTEIEPRVGTFVGEPEAGPEEESDQALEVAIRVLNREK